jgi:hypothetical protein
MGHTGPGQQSPEHRVLEKEKCWLDLAFAFENATRSSPRPADEKLGMMMSEKREPDRCNR